MTNSTMNTYDSERRDPTEQQVRRLARKLFERGLSLGDTKVAIGLLDTEADFLMMEKRIDPLETIDRRTAWGLAISIAEQNAPCAPTT